MNTLRILRYTLITFIWALAFLSLFIFQFPEDRRFTILFINKALAQTAVVLIGLSFLLGPLCKIFHFLSSHIFYRKYFGLLGFTFVVFHIIASLMQFSDRFNLQWYEDHLLGVVAAIISTTIFSILAITSHNTLIRKLSHNWKTIQRTGYIALFLALVHIYFAASPRWQQWISGEVNMPTSFLIFVFGILVIFARLLAIVFTKHQVPPTTSPEITESNKV